MLDRYNASMAKALWSRDYMRGSMRAISDAYTIHRLRTLYGGTSETATLMEEEVLEAPHVDFYAWRSYEYKYRHEIVGFLAAYLDRLPKSVAPYVHLGLTSSDLVEYATQSRMSAHLGLVRVGLFRLKLALRRVQETPEAHMPRAGRTHGQTAELTTIYNQLQTMVVSIDSILEDVDRFRPQFKHPGPTGVADIDVAEVMDILGGILDEDDFTERWDHTPSTQILPRDNQIKWSNIYLRAMLLLEQLAMWVRLGSRSDVAEMSESSTGSQIGSSAMPGKSNPIRSERVCGLARLVRGNHSALCEAYTVWEDRDLSNSSTERVAMHSIAALVEHSLNTMLDVVSSLELDSERIAQNASDPRCTMSHKQMTHQLMFKVGPIEASNSLGGNR